MKRFGTLLFLSILLLTAFVLPAQAASYTFQDPESYTDGLAAYLYTYDKDTHMQKHYSVSRDQMEYVVSMYINALAQDGTFTYLGETHSDEYTYHSFGAVDGYNFNTFKIKSYGVSLTPKCCITVQYKVGGTQLYVRYSKDLNIGDRGFRMTNDPNYVPPTPRPTPTLRPTAVPTPVPTARPTYAPTAIPATYPPSYYWPTAVPTYYPTAAPTPTVLSYGAKGEEVRLMQQRLKDLGYYSGKIDGDFGQGTYNAVKLFQTQHQLSADGVAGPLTLAKLYSSSAHYVYATPSPTPYRPVYVTPTPYRPVYVTPTPQYSSSVPTLPPAGGNILLHIQDLATYAQGALVFNYNVDTPAYRQYCLTAPNGSTASYVSAYVNTLIYNEPTLAFVGTTYTQDGKMTYYSFAPRQGYNYGTFKAYQYGQPITPSCCVTIGYREGLVYLLVGKNIGMIDKGLRK